MSEQNELEILFPEEIDIVVKEKGETLTIKPFKFKKIFKVIKLVADVAEKMASTKDQAEAVFNLIGESEEKVLELFSLSVDKPKEWFDDLDGVTGADILYAIIKVNKSFFDSKLVPILDLLGLRQKEESLNLQNDQNQKVTLTDEEVEALLNTPVEDTIGSTP